jgi:hypothetical protein
MNRSYSKIRHIQEANQKLERRLMKEDSQMEQLSTLQKNFPDIDFDELKDKWEKFMDALESCVGKKEVEGMKLGTAVSIPSCILTIFGLVFSFGLISGFSGAGCASGMLIAGKSIKDVAQCVKSKL